MLDGLRPSPETVTTLSPEAALDFAAERLMPKGYSISSRSPGLLTMAHKEGPEVLLGCALLCFGIVPGLIYLGLAGRTVSYTFTARTEGEATRFTWAADDRVLRMAVEAMLEDLPKPDLSNAGDPFDTRRR